MTYTYIVCIANISGMNVGHCCAPPAMQCKKEARCKAHKKGFPTLTNGPVQVSDPSGIAPIQNVVVTFNIGFKTSLII